MADPSPLEIGLYCGSATPELAASVSAHLGVPLGGRLLRRFPDTEVHFQIEDSIRGKDIYIIQSTSQPVNDHIMELLIMADACKRASAGRITAVIPYYGYARQDRKVAPRAPITAKLVADLLESSGVNRVLTMDLHAGQIQGFFDIPVDNLYAGPTLRDHIARLELENLVVVSPDAGGVERARRIAKPLAAGLAIIDKRRSGPNQAEALHIIGDVRDKDAVIVDDMVDTAGTLTEAARSLMESGATAVHAAITHPVLSGPAVKRISVSPLEQVIVTDTIPLRPDAVESGKLHVVSVAGSIGEAIRRINNEESVSSLF